jgi:hypothetical protein
MAAIKRKTWDLLIVIVLCLFLILVIADLLTTGMLSFF